MKTTLLYLAALLLLTHLRAAETRDLILVAGQSNAVGYDAYASELPPDASDKETMFWWRVGDPPPDEFDVTSGEKWTTLQPQPRGTPLEVKSLPADDPRAKLGRQYGNFKKPEGGFGPEIGLARELRAKGGKPLAIVKVAFSGTGITTDWNPDDPGAAGACYRALIDETKAALAAAAAQGITLRLRALVWVQGENDANAGAAREYEKNLAHLLTRLRADLAAPEMSALLGVNTRFGDGKNPNMPAIVAAQKAAAEKDHRGVYVDTEGAETLPPNTHFTAAGTLEVGRRFAAALLKLEAAGK
ncbi:MAG TPA: sialate O-acetylesterase [Chthoniobacteraceae bacterium]|jgi:hypothetical protein|nr:sialate O-acetylesterase [Chthoniobacteraceae bacterium]